MNNLKIQINRHCLAFDRDYGIDRRTGWSVAVDGSYIVQFESWLVVAIWKAIKEFLNHENRNHKKTVR